VLAFSTLARAYLIIGYFFPLLSYLTWCCFSLHFLAGQTDEANSKYGAYFSKWSGERNGSFSDYTVLANVSAIHALPTFMNMANQAISKNITGNPDAFIAASIHPFSFTGHQRRNIII
jgi:hypothetical protein